MYRLAFFFGVVTIALVGCRESALPPTPSASQAPVIGEAQPLVSPTASIPSPMPSPPPTAQNPPSSIQSNSSPLSQSTTQTQSTQIDNGSGWSSVSGETTSVAKALQDLKAKTTDREIQIDLPADVLFDFDKANIRPDANAALEKLLRIVKAQSQTSSIRVEGHTDSIGNDAYNQTLSEKRAIAVETWLNNKNIAASRITTAGFGEQNPIAPNTHSDGSDNPTGRQKNRRVRVVIAK